MSAPQILPLELVDVDYRVDSDSLLEGVDLRIEAGGPTVILGPNGSGKSLTLRIAHGLLTPTKGSIRWLGGAKNPSEFQAMVFERPVLLRRSVAANLEYVLALRGVGKLERIERSACMLERTGLAALASRRARVLSGGERQRLALARAWILEPEVLFLDEPTAALDPAGTRAVESLIEAISKSGTKVVMTTHDLAQARRLAEDVVFLNGGRVVETAAAASFFDQPSSESARSFLKGELVW